MNRQSSAESNRSYRKAHAATSDSEVSNCDDTEHPSRPSIISSYAEFTESDEEDLLTSDRSASVHGSAESVRNFSFSIFYE
jgi:hypothetical protein